MPFELPPLPYPTNALATMSRPHTGRQPDGGCRIKWPILPTKIGGALPADARSFNTAP